MSGDERAHDPLRWLLTRWRLRNCTSVGPGASAAGPVRVHSEGEVRIGARVLFDSATVPIELWAGPGARLSIGDDTEIGGGCVVMAVESIVIGPGVRLEPFSVVLDNHQHELQVMRSPWRRPASKPVVIEQGARIGRRAVVLPGAWIGAGAELGPASVLGHRLGPGERAGGQPLRPIRTEGR